MSHHYQVHCCAPLESEDGHLVTVGDYMQAWILVSPPYRGASSLFGNRYDRDPSRIYVSRLSVHQRPTPNSER